MHSRQPDNDRREEEAPFNDFDLKMGTSHLISDTPRHKQGGLIQKIEIKPREQFRILLGNFTENNPAKGFSVELNPDPAPAGSVVTEVSSLGTSKKYKLVLHIANYGTRTISAEVWRL